MGLHSGPMPKQWNHGQVDAAGGGGDNGDMEARVAKLEAGVQHLERDVSDIKVELRALRADQRTDFRTTWVGIIAMGLGLAGLMAKGFHWI